MALGAQTAIAAPAWSTQDDNLNRASLNCTYTLLQMQPVQPRSWTCRILVGPFWFCPPHSNLQLTIWTLAIMELHRSLSPMPQRKMAWFSARKNSELSGELEKLVALLSMIGNTEIFHLCHHEKKGTWFQVEKLVEDFQRIWDKWLQLLISVSQKSVQSLPACAGTAWPGTRCQRCSLLQNWQFKGVKLHFCTNLIWGWHGLCKVCREVFISTGWQHFILHNSTAQTNETFKKEDEKEERGEDKRNALFL